MIITELKSLSEKDLDCILKLWNEEYPKSIAHKNLESLIQYLEKLNNKEHIFLKTSDDNLCGWFMAFERDSELWMAMILNSNHQGKGWGSKILTLAKSKYNQLNGWVIDSDSYFKKDKTPYASPLNFYLKNNFYIIHDQRLESKEISTVKIQWKKNKQS